MAITKIWAIKTNANNTINYVGNKDKTAHEDNDDLDDALKYINHDTTTEEKHFVSGINCNPLTAYQEMIATKRLYNKLDSIQAFHAVQSFAPGEISPTVAHEVGIKLANELWGDRFEVVVATHVNKQHIHSHFVINSVSFKDGKRYYDNKNTYKKFRDTSDKLCLEYGFKVVEPKNTGKPYYAWRNEPSKRKIIIKDVERCLRDARTVEAFYKNLKNIGYEVKLGKHVAVKPPWSEHFFRLDKLDGDKYSKENIEERILNNWNVKSTTLVFATYPKKETEKLPPLKKLFIRYMFLLGVLPKGNKNRNVYPHLQGDLRYMDEITKQVDFLSKFGINTSDDLNVRKEKITEQIEFIINSRKSMYGKVKRCKDPKLKEDYQKDIKAYTEELTGLRRELRLCDDIEKRAEDIQMKIDKADEIENGNSHSERNNHRKEITI